MRNVKRSLRTAAPLAFILLGGLLASGCGSGGATLKGKLVQNGQPFKPAEGDTVLITFVGTGDLRTGAAAVYNQADSTFTVDGPENKGVAPGAYKITIKESPMSSSVDKFNGAFGEANTPLKYDVTSDAKQNIVIDLEKKTVVKE